MRHLQAVQIHPPLSYLGYESFRKSRTLPYFNVTAENKIDQGHTPNDRPDQDPDPVRPIQLKAELEESGDNVDRVPGAWDEPRAPPLTTSRLSGNERTTRSTSSQPESSGL